MKIEKITDEKIIFDNGCELYYDHEQDCCEHNYADFEILKTYNISPKTGRTINIYDIEFGGCLVEIFGGGVSNMGFNLKSVNGEKFFIPCYSFQNGYYTDKLILYLKRPYEETEVLDITNFVKEEIY